MYRVPGADGESSQNRNIVLVLVLVLVLDLGVLVLDSRAYRLWVPMRIATLPHER